MSVIETDTVIDDVVIVSVQRTRELIEEARAMRRRSDKTNRKRIARLFRDPRAIEVTVALTDEVMRVHSVRSAIRVLRRAAMLASVRGFGVLNAAGLRVLAALSRVAPAPVVTMVHHRIHQLSKGMILPAERDPLRRHIAARRRDAIAINVNVLGEAVLGENEANERLGRVLEMIARDEVNYVSVKLSSVVSQIIAVDVEGSLQRVSDRLRVLYRNAERHDVFINLDMEEYRDLELTVTAFKRVLSEPEFLGTSGGIVLQAYLPESHHAFADLAAWATSRHHQGGNSVKIRLVKGANLAMEHAEAQLHGWTAAPYATKADVDASYSRLIDTALRPQYADALRIGIASHNLFHLTWAIEVARARGVPDQMDVEMLEGMANAESLAVARTGKRVLLYAPVTRRDDFASAVAYLVRRLDENTSDENYLRAAFDIDSNPTEFEDQRERFLRSVRDRHIVSTESRRHTNVADPRIHNFENEASTDPTDPRALREITLALRSIRDEHGRTIPLVVNGRVADGDVEDGSDPNAGGASWYRYTVADSRTVDQAVAAARTASDRWRLLDADARRDILYRAATIMHDQRATSIAVMARDTGKTVAEGDPEVSEAIDFARFYADTARTTNDAVPIGTVVVAPPWNFPYSIPAGGICAALAAGNAVLLKPAPESVATAYHLATQFWAAGVPRDVLQFVATRDDENGRHLITHPGVDAVILTGSFTTAMMFTRWRPDINLLAETSGKNALLISASADIDAAVKDLVQSAFGHAGQKCSAASLAIVVEGVYEDPAFQRQLIDAVTSLAVGPGWDLSTSMGPIIRRAESGLQRALEQLDPGERWLIEPRQLDETGLLWSPGVKVGVKPGSWSHLNEWFGPVLGIMIAPDLATAIEWQNETDFGLTAGIHSLDQNECEQWIEQVRAGNLYVNRGITGAVVRRQPFGGWRRSSVGPTAKAGGANYVDCLRRWPDLSDSRDAINLARAWWREVGRRALDPSRLDVERNVQRYRRYLGPILVRVDGGFDGIQRSLIEFIRDTAGVRVQFSTPSTNSAAPDATVETLIELTSRAKDVERIRWLSHETPPTTEFLEQGLTVDQRALTQRGDVEMPRWLLEQSVAITFHRYGNAHAGPKPACPGLSGDDDDSTAQVERTFVAPDDPR